MDAEELTENINIIFNRERAIKDQGQIRKLIYIKGSDLMHVKYERHVEIDRDLYNIYTDSRMKINTHPDIIIEYENYELLKKLYLIVENKDESGVFTMTLMLETINSDVSDLCIEALIKLGYKKAQLAFELNN